MPTLTVVPAVYTMFHDQVLTALPDGSSGNFGILHNDTTDTGNPIQITAINSAAFSENVTLPSAAHVNFKPDGTMIYSAPAGFTGDDSFTITASDNVDSATTTVTIHVLPTIAVASVEVNGGVPAYIDSNGVSLNLSGQNSVVEQLLVTFNEPVTLDANAFTITNIAEAVTVNAGPNPSTWSVIADQTAVAGSNNTQWIVTFDPSSDGVLPITGGTGTVIKDGLYLLNTVGSKVHANGETAPIDTHTVFWALYGSNASDNVIGNYNELFVDTPDAAGFRNAFGAETDLPDGTPYVVAFDRDLSGVIDTYDASRFRGNFGTDWSFSGNAVTSDGALSVLHDTNLTIDLSLYAAPTDGGEMVYNVGAPTNGAIAANSDGTYNYTPPVGWTGIASVPYTGVEAGADIFAGNISIDVTDQAPIAVDETYTLLAGLVLNLDSTDGLLHDAFDPDGDPMTVQLVGAEPANGTLNLNADGSFTYQANQGFVGNDTFNYRVSDGATFSGTQTVTIQVQDQTPIASPSSFDVWTAQGVSAGTANVLANATDTENDTLTAVLVSGPTYAAANSFHLNSDGTFTYQLMSNPPSGFNGQDSFTIEAYDGTLDSAPVTVTLNLTGSPVAKDDSYVLGAGGQVYTSATTGVLANEFNPMGGVVTAQLVEGVDPSVGTLVFNQDGSFSFTAGANFQDQASFTYRDLIQVGSAFLPGTTAVVRIAASTIIASTSSVFSVNFDTNADIAADGGVGVDGPQWQVAVGGDAAQAARQDPISFTKNTTVGLTPIFLVNDNMVPFWQSCGNNILVRAVGVPSNACQFFQLGFSQDIHLQLNARDQLTTQGFVHSDDALANSTAYNQALSLTWEISPDGGITWATVGTTADPIYVTLANPNGWNPAAGDDKPTIPLTVLYVATEGSGGGNGATDNASLVANVWTAFQTRQITTASGTPLQYWGGWSTYDQQTMTFSLTRDQLIQSGNGQCTCWTSLFIDSLRAWGDADVGIQSIKGIYTNPTQTVFGAVPGLAPFALRNDNSFLVGNWNLGGAAAIPNLGNNMAANTLLQGWTNYAVVPTVGNGFNLFQTGLAPSFNWINGPGAPATPSAGQNNSNPLPLFNNHSVVLIDGTLYDPSYGVTYAYTQANPLAGIVANLGGFVTVVAFNNNTYNFNLNGAGANNNTSYWVALFKPITVAMLQMR